MTSFAHNSYPTEHPGVARVSRILANIKNLAIGVDNAKTVAVVLLSAIVSALLVVVNQVIETYEDGNLLAAWILLWLITFTAIALLSTPIRQFVTGIKPAYKAWSVARRERANDLKMWEVARQDPRVMAEIQRAVSQQK
jgi:hypothetical protein